MLSSRFEHNQTKPNQTDRDQAKPPSSTVVYSMMIRIRWCLLITILLGRQISLQSFVLLSPSLPQSLPQSLSRWQTENGNLRLDGKTCSSLVVVKAVNSNSNDSNSNDNTSNDEQGKDNIPDNSKELNERKNKIGGNKRSNPVYRNGNKRNKNNTTSSNTSNNSNPKSGPISKEAKKKIVAQAAKDLRKSNNRGDQTDDDKHLLDIVNPFKAGKKLRNALESLTGISESTKSIYLDDRISGGSSSRSISGTNNAGGGMSLAERNPSVQRQSDYTPEVLVVGATGEVGRLVVRRLLLDGNVRIRVLVRDLYSKTLNLLGTGVTYCQGDLANYESLEYALTDVDKIVFCAGAPRQDEDDFQGKFEQYTREILSSNNNNNNNNNSDNDDDSERFYPESPQPTESELEWERMSSVLELRAKLAEQVDCIGMQNLVRAYQNVRFADYGALQTAKRSLFKFGSRNEDFAIFAIDEEEEEDNDDENSDDDGVDRGAVSGFDKYDDEELMAADEDAYYRELSERYDLTEGDEYSSVLQQRGHVLTKTQCLWMRNAFNHAVFVGRVIDASEAAIVSSRLRSREDPDNGIDLSNGFGGFILRVCSDGGTYEAFIRSELYATEGIEYVCKFTTETKLQLNGEKSRNKFTTVRLAFESFKPVKRGNGGGQWNDEIRNVPQFRGSDIRYLGFRFSAQDEAVTKPSPDAAFFFKSDTQDNRYRQFYLAFDYIKVYRAQPEPEFVYLSDARIPRVITGGMVRHDRKQIREKRDSILDESDVLIPAVDQRSSEETYYKYRGEEILKGSGLAYTIVRVAGFNEVSFGEAATIKLSTEPSLEAVSRSDVAQVCALALLDPNALNKSFYMAKSLTAATSEDENISAKFSRIPMDA